MLSIEETKEAIRNSIYTPKSEFNNSPHVHVLVSPGVTKNVCVFCGADIIPKRIETEDDQSKDSKEAKTENPKWLLLCPCTEAQDFIIAMRCLSEKQMQLDIQRQNIMQKVSIGALKQYKENYRAYMEERDKETQIFDQQLLNIETI